MEISEYGDVRLRNKVTGAQFTIEKVLFMPNSGRKLLSEIRMKASGCSYADDGKNRKILKPNGDVLATARQGVNNSELYVFDNLEVVKAKHQTSTTSEIYSNLDSDSQPTAASKLLHAHRRYGHLNFAACRKMLGMKASKENPRCDACEVAKATTAKMSAVTSRPKAETVINTLHSDIGFAKDFVFQLTADEYSGRIFF